MYLPLGLALLPVPVLVSSSPHYSVSSSRQCRLAWSVSSPRAWASLYIGAPRTSFPSARIALPLVAAQPLAQVADPLRQPRLAAQPPWVIIGRSAKRARLRGRLSSNVRLCMKNSSIVHAVSALVNERYVFPVIAERVVSHLSQRLGSGAYDISDEEEFASRLTDDLRHASGDLHLRVRHSAEPHIPEESGDTVREQNDRAKHCREMGYGIASAHRLESAVAILDIRELVEPELSRSAYDTAFSCVADASALIIDLRQCVGGDPNTVALVCSNLVDSRTQLSSIVPRSAQTEHFWADPTPYPRRFGGKKPLFITVSDFTFSGAEMLAYDLQAIGRAVVVGAVTGGGANPCAFHWPSPHFSLLLPEASAVNPITGSNWEARGVAPNVPCPEDEALSVAMELAQKGASNA